jgi:hypothetical protein
MDRRGKKQNILSGISARVKNSAPRSFVGAAKEFACRGKLDAPGRER